MPTQPTVAYFSMEIGLTAEMPTYSGGLVDRAKRPSQPETPPLFTIN